METERGGNSHLSENSRQRLLEVCGHVLGLLPSLVEHKGTVGTEEEREDEEDAGTAWVGCLFAVALGSVALSRDVFRQRALSTGKGQSTKGRGLHGRLGHKFHALCIICEEKGDEKGYGEFYIFSVIYLPSYISFIYISAHISYALTLT